MKLLFFDLETTGLNPERHRIIQFYGLHSDGRELHFLCNPEQPVEKDAQRAHGYKLSDLKAYPNFKHFASQVQQMIDNDTVVCGYNSRTFDTIMLHHELVRNGERGLATDPLTDDICQPEIDLFKIWKTLEPRNLAGALKRFGIEVDGDNFHDARFDVAPLPRLLDAMARTFDASETDLVSLTTAGEVDRAGKFRFRDDDGEIVFNFGKFRDGVARDQPGYLRWMVEKGDFPSSTLEVARRILREKGQLA